MSNDINISPISYTNKDFRAIYEELLDLVNDLTARWDPKSTNESDPGLVLLKLKAFIADKLNYNIDKNILENFPSQATQRGNAQKIYDILGYGMKYYQSATTEVTLRYKKPDSSEDLKGESYTIPAFTQLTDGSGKINYVTTEAAKVAISKSVKSTTTVPVIEGIAQDLTINGNSLITVDNLDSDYRIYFTETRIAQNGIYINSSEDSTYWEAVDNLEATQLGQKVFKFGVLPNTSTCYLEFPQDAATLFGNGINIKYIITSGIEGNISFGVLSSIANSLVDKKDTKIDYKLYTLVVQPGSATNGRDPESLQEAYRNCKRTINTFNTLITTKDYENALLNSGVVSNCVVSDRTNDISRSYKVMSKTKDGDGVTYLNTTDNDGNPDMTAFDISLYALSPVSSIEDADSFNKSFQAYESTTLDAEYAIEKYKSIQHNYKNIESLDSPFIYKNLVSLKGTVLTYQKVTEAEATEIESNINKNLYKNYNSKMLDFGKELDYTALIENVKKSDDRIKTVVLEYPEYVIKQMNYQNKISDLNNLNDSKKTIGELEANIIAKSILAGVTPYCIFSNSEKLDFSMTKVEKASDIKIDGNGVITYTPSDTTSDALSLSESTFGDDKGHIACVTTSTVLHSGVTLKENENVFCVGPSFVSKAQLSTCLYYALVSGSTPFTIDPNSYYILGENEYLLVTEGITRDNNLDFSSSKKHWIYFGANGDIIHPTMKITSKKMNGIPSITDWNDKVAVTPSDNLGTSDTIEILNKNTVNINEDESKTIYAAWSCDTLYNRLFETSDIKYIDADGFVTTEAQASKVQVTKLLQNNDIFIYTDENKQDLILLGSGTEITIRSLKDDYYSWATLYGSNGWEMPTININNISTHGVNSSIEWNKIPNNVEFLISEKQIITLGKGVTLNWSDNNKTIDNSPKNLTKFTYKYEGESDATSLPTIKDGSGNNYNWEIFSRLSLVLSPTQGQKLLYESGKRSQAVTLYKANYNKNTQKVDGYNYLKYDGTNSDEGLSASTLTGGYYITANNIVALSGGVKQNSLVMTQNGVEDNLTFYVAGKKDSISSALSGWSDLDGGIGEALIQEEEDYALISIINKSSNTITISDLTLNLSPRFDNSLIPILALSSDDNCILTPSNGDDSNTTLKYEGATPIVKNKKGEVIKEGAISLKENQHPVYVRLNASNKKNPSSLTLKLSLSDLKSSANIYLYNPLKIQSRCKYLDYEYLGQDTEDTGDDKTLNDLINSLAVRDGKNIFNYSYQVDEETLIEEPLDPESFFDSNHICNRYTIAQLNTQKDSANTPCINIKVASQSLQSRRK